MKLTLPRVLFIIILVLALVAFFLYTRDATSPGEEPTAESPIESDIDTQCPIATPEFFFVEPVTSPTDQLTQTITVDLGNGETITVTTESGTFSAPFDTFPTEIEITLLPNTGHSLTVEGRVREVVQGDCTYGGYVLTTTTDRNGQPLIIEQREP
jgi:hypothetical protein